MSTEEKKARKSPPFIVTVAKWTQVDFRSKAKHDNKLQLITIGYSHYCEFARFALLAGGVPFDDHTCIPGQHVLPTLALRFSGETPVMSDSTAMTKLGTPPDQISKAERSSRATATPVAVTPEGEVVPDSWTLAALAGLEPCDSALKEILDAQVAVDSRHVAYYYFLQPRNVPLFHEMGGQSTDSWTWRALWACGMKHTVTEKLSGIMSVNDTPAKDAAVDRLKKAFEHINDKFLKKGKGKYLGGGGGAEQPGLADIALAALAAPVVLPDENYGAKYAEPISKFLVADAELKTHVDYFRATPVGKHCLMVYKEHRPMMGANKDV